MCHQQYSMAVNFGFLRTAISASKSSAVFGGLFAPLLLGRPLPPFVERVALERRLNDVIETDE